MVYVLALYLSFYKPRRKREAMAEVDGKSRDLQASVAYIICLSRA